jgi:hypothetical protein
MIELLLGKIKTNAIFISSNNKSKDINAFLTNILYNILYIILYPYIGTRFFIFDKIVIKTKTYENEDIIIIIIIRTGNL